MAFAFSGRAAQGAHDNLQELLASTLAEEMARAEQAQRDRQLGQTDRRIGLDEQQLAQQAAQHTDRMGLDLKQLEEAAHSRRDAANQRGVLDLHKTAELQLDEQERRDRANQAGVEDMERQAKLIQDDPDAELQRDLRRINAQGAWSERVAGERSSGGGGATGAAAQKAASKAKAAIDKLDALSKAINTESGPMARIGGAFRTGAGKIGLDDKITEYNGLIGLTLPGLARELGHVGVLTQQDVDSVLNGLPKPNSTKGERDLLIQNVRDLIGQRISEYEARTGQTLGTDTAAPPTAKGRRKYNPQTGGFDPSE